MPLPRISEELKESESAEDSQASSEFHTDAVVQEHRDDPLEEIKVEDDGIERAVGELEQYNDALRQAPDFDD